jgi:hypothetical protein
MAYVVCDYSGMVKCKNSHKLKYHHFALSPFFQQWETKDNMFAYLVITCKPFHYNMQKCLPISVQTTSLK